MRKYHSPLRYPGGKAKLSDFFIQVVEKNNLDGCTYVEPFAGGASIALTLLFGGWVDKVVINDKDRSIYAFWYSVLYDTENLIRLINDTPVNMDEWHRLRQIQSKNVKDKVKLLELGFSTFFMNRTNRSGIIKAGVIGGKNQSGNYKMDVRYNKSDLIERISIIAQHRDKIELHCDDALSFLEKDNFGDKSIIYLDPPYYVKGSGLYMNSYSDSDHKDIARQITSMNDCNWIVTYDNVDFIKNLYNSYRQKEFELTYTAGKKGKGSEVMIFSDNIKIPDHKLFTK